MIDIKHFGFSKFTIFCQILFKWSTLAEEQKRQYAEEAAALKVQRTSDDMSSDMRCLKLKKHLKQMKIEVASLEKLGVETGVMMYDHQKPFLKVLEVSSKGASSFFNSTDVLDNFALHFKGKSSSTSAAKEPVDPMVKKVQELFNRKYSKSWKCTSTTFPALITHANIKEIIKLDVPQNTVVQNKSIDAYLASLKKNAKKWREWLRCNTCEQWSHLACGFKKNLCRHCQTPRS
uniref:Uncharacterized protein n=1 Tax=Xiphophorus maculatus TaxID=8083 RepID=A0A3B5R534_XIPMA